MKKQRWTAVLAVLLVFAMLFSALYIALEAHHECTGEGCAVCAQIRACMELLCQLLTAAAVLMTADPLCPDAGEACRPLPHHCGSDTLISLKVKLSD
ncbi:MAG: hypothetical protein K6C08_15885 [Oscillospiraceae bacterium]|nr:hypothetical protein [Oscillospiraceae bacterium]